MLRGAGAAIALPWLESLHAWSGGVGVPPRRFAVLFMGNGVNGRHWWATGAGESMRLGPSLSPLETVKRKVVVIEGLTNAPGRGCGIHPAQTGGLLSGVRVGRRALEAGTTVDQVVAGHFAGGTAARSLVLSCEPPIGGRHESGYAGAYSSYLSWAAPDRPVPAALDPGRVFTRLFGTADRRSSVLDAVGDARRGLAQRLGAGDRPRMDAYLTRVRDTELRIRRAGRADDRDAPPDIDVRDRARLMCDLVALAFQNDSTRVASLVLARDLSSLRYPFLGVAVDHHEASHDDLSDAYERITRFHVGQLAYLAQTLDAMPEGDGTVLDHCCLLWLSNMWSGWKHDNLKLPVVLAGGLGGTIPTGRTLDYLHRAEEHRKLSSLYLTILQRLGVRTASFGDAETPLF